jgi:chloride channel, nucleotide-sensitive, 1A
MISLHAIQAAQHSTHDAESLFLQLVLGDSGNLESEDDVDTLEITLIPTSQSPTAQSTAAPSATATDTDATSTTEPPHQQIADTPTPSSRAQTIGQQLYAAISSCAELNPDPQTPDENGMLDMTAPGATGWITSENADQFFDENGQFIGGGSGMGLGAGAGTVRLREAEETLGDGEGDEETKWRRTS